MGSVSEAEILSATLSLENAVSLLSGCDFWHTREHASQGIGALRFSDGPNGVRGENWVNGPPSLAIPCATALGASFDTGLVFELSKLLATECNRKGVHALLAPTMNIHRYPLCGRNFESFSEDPILSGRIATAFVKGLQSKGIAACPKHFLGNEAENGRRWSDSVIEQRALREIYLEPFRVVVQDGDPWSLMTAYNSVNGQFCSESNNLISILREEWKYQNAVVSDWFGTYSSTAALNAGLDLEMPGPSKFRTYEILEKAMRYGDITKKQILESAERILDLLSKTGRIGLPGSPPPCLTAEADHVTVLAQEQELLRQATQASIVLLKNDNDALPLPDSAADVTIFGQHAIEPALFGGGSASLKVPSSTLTPWGSIARDIPGAIFVDGVYTNRLIKTLGKAGITTDSINLDWYNGSQAHAHKHFLRQTLDDSLYMLVEDVPQGLVDRSDFCTVMSFHYTPDNSGDYQLSITGPGSAQCFVDDKLLLDVHRDLTVSTEDFLFDRSKLETHLSYPLHLVKGHMYSFKIISWSSKHKLENVNREFFIQGCRFGLQVQEDEEAILLEAERKAAATDNAIIFVGTGSEWESEGFDRESMQLPRRQNEMVHRVASACPGRTTVVINAGSPIDTSPWYDSVDAIVQIWFPGMGASDGLVNVLTGKFSPCARLPTTFWDNVKQYPAGHVEKLMTTDKKIAYREGLFVGYRQVGRKSPLPRFAFGHGLSYSRFEYRVVGPESLPCSNSGDLDEIVADVKVEVTNIGAVPAHETVLLFVGAETIDFERPQVELKAFGKTSLLAPGGTEMVSLSLSRRSFSFWDVSTHSWKVNTGSYHILFPGPRGVGDWRGSGGLAVDVRSC